MIVRCSLQLDVPWRLTVGSIRVATCHRAPSHRRRVPLALLGETVKPREQTHLPLVAVLKRAEQVEPLLSRSFSDASGRSCLGRTSGSFLARPSPQRNINEISGVQNTNHVPAAMLYQNNT